MLRSFLDLSFLHVKVVPFSLVYITSTASRHMTAGHLWQEVSIWPLSGDDGHD